MHEFIYIRASSFTYARAHLHTRELICIRASSFTYARAHLHTRELICIRASSFTYARAHLHTRELNCIYLSATKKNALVGSDLTAIGAQVEGLPLSRRKKIPHFSGRNCGQNVEQMHIFSKFCMKHHVLKMNHSTNIVESSYVVELP